MRPDAASPAVAAPLAVDAPPDAPQPVAVATRPPDAASARVSAASAAFPAGRPAATAVAARHAVRGGHDGLGARAARREKSGP